MVVPWLATLMIAYGFWGCARYDRCALVTIVLGEMAWLWAAIMASEWALVVLLLLLLLSAPNRYIKWGPWFRA